jgi:hypothetical protein
VTGRTMMLSEPGTVDFLYLLDRLEEALVTGSRVPLTARTLVDEQECLDIIDQMRARGRGARELAGSSARRGRAGGP